jgi:hypothetical protein
MSQAKIFADAVNNFIVGCKSDGIWNSIRCCCIMAGWANLSGCLFPIKGPAPTNINFTENDYNRKTGLAGNGTNKYLNTNLAGNANFENDPQNDFHLSVNLHTIHSVSTSAGAYIGHGGTNSGASNLVRTRPSSLDVHCVRNRSSTCTNIGNNPPPVGFFGSSRFGSTVFFRNGGNNSEISQSSQTPPSDNIFVFCRNNSSGSPELYTDARINFYAIGRFVNLTQLDARVSALISEFSKL